MKYKKIDYNLGQQIELRWFFLEFSTFYLNKVTDRFR